MKTTYYQRRDGKLYITYADSLGIVGGLFEVNKDAEASKFFDMIEQYLSDVGAYDGPGTTMAFRASIHKIWYVKNHFTLMRELALGITGYAVFRCVDRDSGYTEYMIMEKGE